MYRQDLSSVALAYLGSPRASQLICRRPHLLVFSACTCCCSCSLWLSSAACSVLHSAASFRRNASRAATCSSYRANSCTCNRVAGNNKTLYHTPLAVAPGPASGSDSWCSVLQSLLQALLQVVLTVVLLGLGGFVMITLVRLLPALTASFSASTAVRLVTALLASSTSASLTAITCSQVAMTYMSLHLASQGCPQTS